MKIRQSSTRWLGLALACGLLTFAVTTQAAKPPKPPPTPTGPAYRIVSLGSLGGPPVSVSSINEAGQVTGGGHSGDYQSIPFVVTPESSSQGPVYFRDTSPADGINDLIRPLPIPPGARDSWPENINNRGIVAGSYLPPGPDSPYRAMIWAGETPVDLGIVCAEDTFAFSINNLGLAVTGPGQWWEIYAPCHVVVPKDSDGDSAPDTWFEDANADGVNDLLKLVSLPSDYDPVYELWWTLLSPEGINDNGQIILDGWQGGGFLLRPDYTDADGDGNPWYADTNGDDFNDLLVELIGLGGDDSYAKDINAAGQVVGSSNKRAVRWDIEPDGRQTATDLGLLSKSVRSMGAAAINDNGEIVGNASFTSSRTAFLYKNGKLYDLAAVLTNGTGWEKLSASDINNQGIIVGSGYLNGVAQGFVAVPVTQP